MSATPTPNPIVAAHAFWQFTFTDTLQAAVAVIAVVIAVLAYRASSAATKIANSSLTGERERNAKSERKEFIAVLRILFDERLEEVRTGIDENKPLYAYTERGLAASLDSPGGEQIIGWMEAVFTELVGWPQGTFRGYFVLATKSMFEMRTAAWIKDPLRFDATALNIKAEIDIMAERLKEAAPKAEGAEA